MNQQQSTSAIYWFRRDLRLHDHPALHLACQHAASLFPVYCHDPSQSYLTKWQVPRISSHRQRFLASALMDLDLQLRALDSQLSVIVANPVEALITLAKALGVTHIYCEEIAAPEEQAVVNALRDAGLTVHTVWQSSLLRVEDLPFSVDALPDVFTTFRLAVERAQLLPRAVVLRPNCLPASPPMPKNGLSNRALMIMDAAQFARSMPEPTSPTLTSQLDQRSITTDTPLSAFPYHLPAFQGGEGPALAHAARYFASTLPQSYKQTRNHIIGVDYSTKFSPWLAQGAISAPMIMNLLRQHEAEFGANDSTYWIGFELLWRDYFQFLHLKYGNQLYRACGLAGASSTALTANAANAAKPTHDMDRFAAWCTGQTKHAFVNAAMIELATTGYLSNRMRQIVASYLIYDLACDWRAGAAWFEAQLLDYDVYSNQGNWLYIAGRGTDPRQGRRFDPDKQQHQYDPDGRYQQRWGTQ